MFEGNPLPGCNGYADKSTLCPPPTACHPLPPTDHLQGADRPLLKATAVCRRLRIACYFCGLPRCPGVHSAPPAGPGILWARRPRSGDLCSFWPPAKNHARVALPPRGGATQWVPARQQKWQFVVFQTQTGSLLKEADAATGPLAVPQTSSYSSREPRAKYRIRSGAVQVHGTLSSAILKSSNRDRIAFVFCF